MDVSQYVRFRQPGHRVTGDRRELALQSRVGNEVAGTQAHREIVLHWKKFSDVFIRYPELHAYYYDETPNPPNATDGVRLRVIAEQHADFLDVALITTRQLASYEYTGMSATWDDYVASTVGSSASFVRLSEKSGGRFSTRSFPATTNRRQPVCPKRLESLLLGGTGSSPASEKRHRCVSP